MAMVMKITCVSFCPLNNLIHEKANLSSSQINNTALIPFLEHWSIDTAFIYFELCKLCWSRELVLVVLVF